MVAFKIVGSVDQGLPSRNSKFIYLENLPDSQNISFDIANIRCFSFPTKFFSIFLC